MNVPIDRQIQSWTTTTLPTDWEGVRDRWERYHLARTFVSVTVTSAGPRSVQGASSARGIVRTGALLLVTVTNSSDLRG